MTTKKEYRARALKAWRTRRKNADAKVGGKCQYSKKVRHLAALKAWRTRRKNTAAPDILHGTCLEAGCDNAVNCEDGESRCKMHAKKPARMSKKEKRHMAAVKAWKTRKRNAEIEHETEMDDAENIV